MDRPPPVALSYGYHRPIDVAVALMRDPFFPREVGYRTPVADALLTSLIHNGRHELHPLWMRLAERGRAA